MGGKTGTTNDNTDGWFIGYTPQLLAGAWVGCDDPFLKIRWTYGGNEMAMPEWAYFMQKVYADKKLGIDPNAQFVSLLILIITLFMQIRTSRISFNEVREVIMSRTRAMAMRLIIIQVIGACRI